MKEFLRKKQQLYYLLNILLQSLIVMCFYSFFIIFGLFYNGLGLSKNSFDFIVLLSKTLPLYIPPLIFAAFAIVLKIKINFLTLLINSSLITITGILVLDFIASPNLILGLIILIFLAFIFRSQIKRILKLKI